ncbi:MAG: cytochrome c3 family protein, partial [Desulfobacterales bacterium]|nr:cytochrome c3 family protein [Desulfobacterales bacterium]
WLHSWNFDVSISSVVLTGGYVFDIAPKTLEVSQPIDFPHYHHVEEVGIKCEFCHKTVKKEDFATIPKVETCKLCHSQKQTNSSREAVLREKYVEPDRRIPWKQVYKVPPHVYFSHKRHIVAGKIECTTCHGPVPQQNHALTKPLNEITMEFCIDCHVEKKKEKPIRYEGKQFRPTEDCLKCHR